MGERTTPAHPFLVTAMAPLIPHVLGSIFNIWYNMAVIDPLLRLDGLRDRFIATVIVWNALVYPIAVAIWVGLIVSLWSPYQKLCRGEVLPEAKAEAARRRLINLPWSGATISGLAWLLGIPFFLGSLLLSGRWISLQLFWHLPISFAVSGFIALTQSFYLIELASHWGLFPVFFHDVRPDLLKGIRPISLRTRGLMWAVSAGICPIVSLLLLIFAPPSSGISIAWFGLFVGSIGIAFGVFSGVLIGRSVGRPVSELRAAAAAVTEGRLNVHVPLRRADEFGALIGQFNTMVAGLREKEQLRRTFGHHVGQKVAEQILERYQGLGGTEEEITVMFADIRSFTARAAHLSPDKAVAILNEFLGAMVEVVEAEHGGMINKFLGDGFMAIFGVGSTTLNHADQALAAARSMLKRLEELNLVRGQRGDDPLEIGIGLNTGPGVVGSIGSPERMEFTAIGNTVNLASRIEALNKTLRTSLLISKSTRDALTSRLELRALPPQPVKGVNEPVEVFTL